MYFSVIFDFHFRENSHSRDEFQALCHTTSHLVQASNTASAESTHQVYVQTVLSVCIPFVRNMQETNIYSACLVFKSTNDNNSQADHAMQFDYNADS